MGRGEMALSYERGGMEKQVGIYQSFTPSSNYTYVLRSTNGARRISELNGIRFKGENDMTRYRMIKKWDGSREMRCVRFSVR